METTEVGQKIWRESEGMEYTGRAEIYKRGERIAELEAALKKIANSPHCSYENNPGQYGTGVADGHRCAANMAREALK